MAMQDSDNLIVGRGNASYKISYAEFVAGIEPPEPPPVDPIVVGKGVITPSTDVYVGTELIGSATVTDAVNPVETHVWEFDGVEDQRGTSYTYIAKEGVIRYRKEVTDDNHQTPTIGEWSDPVTATVPPVVEPTMHGLRFDNKRVNALWNPQAPTGPFTVSVWVKPSTEISTSSQNILGGYLSKSVLLLKRNLDVSAHGNSVFGVLNPNQWNNVVFSFDGYTTRGWVNGVEGATNGDGSVNAFDGGAIWGSASGGFKAGQTLDGYLSDAYIVDGKVLEATAFGESVNGKWKPLDSSVVKQNIDGAEREQPYDYRPNTDQVWSSGGTGTWAEPVTSAFDGSLTTTGAYTNGNPGTINFTGLTSVDSLRVYGNAGTELDYWVVTTDGGEFNPAWSTLSGAQWADIPVSLCCVYSAKHY